MCPVLHRARSLEGHGQGECELDTGRVSQVRGWKRPRTMEAMQQNMTWDGLFHAAVWLLTVLGVYLLLNTPAVVRRPQTARRSPAC
jgi:hypothetical protein